MNELKGINVSSTIVPFTDIDKYPTHLAEYGKGGFRTVQEVSDLSKIYTERLEEGMLVYVVNDDSGVHTYQYLGGSWQGCRLGGGVIKAVNLDEALTLPINDGDLLYIEDKNAVYLKTNGAINPINSNGVQIYTQSQISELSAKGALPDQYIAIPDPEDLYTEAPYYEVPVLEGGARAYTKTGNGGYVGILFSALRELQAKVAMMENSFKYGLYSYTGRSTAMSEIGSELAEYDENEPLWAIDESELSEITNASVVFNVNTNLYPIGNVKFNVEGTEATILGTTHWTDKDENLKDSEDAKLFLYMTAATRDQIITLRSLVEEDSGEEPQVVKIELSKFNLPTEGRYNVCICLSRKYIDITKEEKPEYGENSAWVSISGFDTAETILEGYLIIGEDGSVVTSHVYSDPRDTHKRYYFYDVELEPTTLYKLKFYSKYQDFSKHVTPSKPTDRDYRYKVAHITIRSVENSEELDSIKDYLPKNELIFRESDNTLWIKQDAGRVVQISGKGGSDPEPTPGTGMNEQEIIELLIRMGIVSGKIVTKKDENDKDVKYYSELSINSIADLTFIHEKTGKSFNITVDEEGNVVSRELSKSGTTIAEVIKANETSTDYAMSTEDGVRGLAARYFSICSDTKIKALQAKDIALNSDRVKIGSFYAPLSTDNVFGCSHAYIELENTSNKDFPLDGCYIHWLRHNPKTQALEVLHHELSGTLKAGSTYLIRGKQYADPETSENCFVNVSEYDDLWYEGDTSDLIDLSINKTATHSGITGAYAFALTYGEPDLTYTTSLVSKNPGTDTYPAATYEYMWKWFYIDSLVINAVTNKTSPTWSPTSTCITANSNTIVKNTFELDPAKQAFQALNMADSSRERGAKYGTDIQYVSLANEFITFPNSTEAYPVKNYTPRCSKSKKNVSTDKTKLNLEKPNMVTCSFGMNTFTTRCFNWISAGSFDEYVWLKDPQTGAWTAFQSYTTLTAPKSTAASFPRRKEYSLTINNATYARIYSYFPGCNVNFTSHKCVIDVVSQRVSNPTTYTYRVGRRTLDPETGKYVIDEAHASEEYTFTLYPENYKPQIYQTSDQQGFHWIEYQVWAAAAIKLNNKINKDVAKGGIVPVLLNTGDMTQNGTRINEWLDYYIGGLPLFKHLEQMNVVGNNDLCGTVTTDLGTGDDTGKSNSYYFHLFYCYDVFDILDNDVAKVDMTQNIAASSLQTENATMNIVEDNLVRLASGEFDVDSKGKYKAKSEFLVTIPNYVSSDTYAVTKSGSIYTLDYVRYKTSGDNYIPVSSYVKPDNFVTAEEYPVTKNSNNYTYNYKGSELYHIRPIIKGSDNVFRTIPSLYYFDFKDYRVVMINSELTPTNTINWFKKSVEYPNASGVTTVAINPYTGWEILINPSTTSHPNAADDKYHGDFVSIYTMLYTIFSEAQAAGKKIIPAMHEMPFTVITKAELKPGTKDANCPKRYRSINSKNKLIGSHLNQMDGNDVASVHWFSRLLEYFGINIALGGHKHTYTCTYPCQENYIWYAGKYTGHPDGSGTEDRAKSTPKYSYNDRMDMEKTLANDNWRCLWFDAEGKNLTKLPLLSQKPEGIDYPEEELTEVFLPYDSDETHIGWRSKYNGVLYFMCQATGYKLTSNKELPTIYQAYSQLIPMTTHKADGTDSADSSQTYPMFVIVSFDDSTNKKAKVFLARIDNIMKGGKFTQSTFLSGTPYLQFAQNRENSRFCNWTNIGGSEAGEDGAQVTIVETIL